MTQTIPSTFTTHAAYAGVRCTGRKTDGSPCRAITTGTVTVQGREHFTCKPHAAQVEAREITLVTAR